MVQDLQSDIETVGRIEAVPTILEVVCRTTGMRFAAVARVTEDRWIACSVLDPPGFPKESREVSELREQFIAVLGHDLRTPLRGITCFTDLLLKTPLDKRGVEMAGIIRDSASRMRGLIENLMDLTRGRLGGGLLLNRDSQEPLEPVLRAVIAELNASMPDRVVETDFTFLEPINCDRSRIAQLFSNLLSNAFSYGATGRAIRVEANSAGGNFELSVANAGEPIPAEALGSLFQPFYRSAAGMANREGLGLGLYIAHQIATAHRGTLRVTSTREETRFIFQMPLDAAAFSGSEPRIMN